MRSVALITAVVMVVAGPLLPIPVSGTEAERTAPPRVPDKLRPPQGYTVLLKVQAEGVQVYVSKEAGAGKFAWAFKAPLADLSQGGKRAGYHYAGPSWEAFDGSKVVRDDAEEVVSVPAPDPKADIPWLRIQVRPDRKVEGMLGKVQYVLRVDTRGGVAPGQAPKRAGTEVGVRYRATYYFYGPAR